MLLKFSKISDMPSDVIDKYCHQVPSELLHLWKNYGLGYLLNGYLKVINPDVYLEFVRRTYFRGALSIPIFLTAFGDIVTLEEQKYLRLVRYKDGDFISILENMHYFLDDLEDEGLLEDYFEIPLYEEAVRRFGSLSYEQCFGFVPLLSVGGKKDIANIDKVSIKEYLSLITQFTGGVGIDD
ncbi:T6SS immunity protein Tdi1 domain-containing protein [Alloscardovia omnicolens]|uniref:T6SS immunity protein Tdi1 domain-containing protein n=1 Tax=Alloscardovia omnicolens TaxID=419015 RepID=UPI003A6C5E40